MTDTLGGNPQRRHRINISVGENVGANVGEKPLPGNLSSATTERAEKYVIIQAFGYETYWVSCAGNTATLHFAG